jgi:hypothetical protein
MEMIHFLQTQHLAKTLDLLSYLRLHSLLSTGHPAGLALNLNDLESGAVFSTSNILLGDEKALKETVLSGFLSGEGRYEGVPCKLPSCHFIFSPHTFYLLKQIPASTKSLNSI